MTARDRRTGRYRHFFCFIGPAIAGQQGEVSECDTCPQVRVSSVDGDRVFKDREAARRAGITFLEGY